MKKILALLLVTALFVFSTILSQTLAFASASTPNPYEPFPTATAYASLVSDDDKRYTNDEFGFSISIPDGVVVNETDPDEYTFQVYTLGDNEAFGYLLPIAMSTGQDLKDVGETALSYFSGWLNTMDVIKDEEIALPHGKSAWYTQVRGEDAEYGQILEIRLYTVINAGHAVTLEFSSLPENFIYWGKVINKMLDSITLTAPVVMGFPRDQVLIMEGGESTNPVENDPATMHGSGDYLIFEGLVTYNQNMEIIPALAASWEISDDGTVYTFHLQPDAVFHNGKPFTAADVVYSWQRAADPQTNSDTVMTYLNDIVGVKEMHEGSAANISGLKVMDEHTLQVTIDAPKPYFLYKLTYSTASIVDRDNVESSLGWYRTPNGTGPYRLVRWDSMEKMIYERFDGYYGTPPAIQAVIYTLYTGDSFRLYEEGAVDVSGVATYNVERVTDPSDPLNQELITGVSLCTSYIQFDVTQPPFDDVKVRQAFSLAFDKQKYLDVVLKNTDISAKGLYPPALPGYSLDLQGYDFDPQRARQLIAESKYGSVEAFPEIVFTTGGYGSYTDSLVAALSHMWQQNLGVTISIQNIDPQRMLDSDVAAEYGQLSATGWCADYPDPENFADVLFHTGSEMNNGNYSNPELDRILELARVEPDVNARINLYQQAEKIIVEDAAALFLYHSTSYMVVKPYIQGFTLSPVSTYPLIRYLSIDQAYWN